ncbi:MAG: tRNA dimethylallyltransferase [Vicingaceae bacterium]|jgi:tRNA dimethylallyltransferase
MELIVILGPTAVGKTSLAVNLADKLEGEIISADSRQVYRGMDLGTGKDLEEYNVDGRKIRTHLIDIKDAGNAYNVFDFQKDFYASYIEIEKNKKRPILCGGSGLYLESALAKEKMLEVPFNQNLRDSLKNYSQTKLVEKLKSLQPKMHNETDRIDRERTIRAIEIELFKNEDHKVEKSPIQKPVVFGIKMDREKLRERIEVRLNQRLDDGMVQEVERLLEAGVSHQQLLYYGLEYKFIAQYLNKELPYDQMVVKLLQAIRQFAKRQMTWYRRMEKKGQKIHWIDADESAEEKLRIVLEIVK